MDLFANARQTFFKVTLPLIFPGILAGGLLAFALSIDDFVVTQFNSGAEQTFPLYIYGAAARGIPPQVNVVGTLIFSTAVGLMLINTVWSLRKGRADA